MALDAEAIEKRNHSLVFRSLRECQVHSRKWSRNNLRALLNMIWYCYIFFLSINSLAYAIFFQLNKLVKETKGFLTEYDSIVLHKELYRILFLYTLCNLREKLVKLLQKFSTLPKRDSKDKTVECCGVSDQVCYNVTNLNGNVFQVSFDMYDDFREHYDQSHNKKTLQSASLCEVCRSMYSISKIQTNKRF